MSAVSFSGLAFLPCWLLFSLRWSRAVGVGWPAKFLCVRMSRRASPPALLFDWLFIERPQSLAFGDTCPASDPPESLPDVRRADAVCAQYLTPEGVTFFRQVCLYSIDPDFNLFANLSCNDSFSELVRSGVIAALKRPDEISLKLSADGVGRGDLLPEDGGWSALGDEPVERGPEVALVRLRFPLAGGAERLAGAAPGPDGPVVGPACELQGVGPSADAGDEMALGEVSQLIRSHLRDSPFVHFARRNLPGLDE